LKGCGRPAGLARVRAGKPIVNMFPLAEGEKDHRRAPVRAFDGEHFVFMATANGTVKKTPLPEFANPRKAGLIAVDWTRAISDRSCDHGRPHDVMLFSGRGQGCPVSTRDSAAMAAGAPWGRGRHAADAGSPVIACWGGRRTAAVLTATAHGYGKRTPITEYTRHSRGTKGMIAIAPPKQRAGLAATLVNPDDRSC